VSRSDETFGIDSEPLAGSQKVDMPFRDLSQFLHRACERMLAGEPAPSSAAVAVVVYPAEHVPPAH
jgi:hypothetical protein